MWTRSCSQGDTRKNYLINQRAFELPVYQFNQTGRRYPKRVIVLMLRTALFCSIN